MSCVSPPHNSKALVILILIEKALGLGPINDVADSQCDIQLSTLVGRGSEFEAPFTATQCYPLPKPKTNYNTPLERERYHGVGWPLWISEKALPKDISSIFHFFS
ncbi:hypothetical protein VNO77_42266 [Canavalia gladiata]|uniref:Uncharacterized protein n=1 Tax=Canavalia gladiata TaxID=3824 RepID=A0AAN9PS93_CANGL